mmetsp:Transcript_9264/g.13446  ORF Transcript_9264/g.13446 Transcript_9264/m.13446 type:complete len:174 (-) Transcript_9264:104-625(-)|eukprot:CAMPEP_0172424884 /NCGR_PEP_ID=MMETSP1064-20121228/28638_1 /TAXON_ID=202472 /ORGANISM="Aulacoseira subarctica , Strain CCAP 1002/5" /LENGTH=173 /DNA_ID=CAMNT_0013167311 /DNA_START=977 /DNA_END=1498 /DNA_ORIENTATION=+
MKDEKVHLAAAYLSEERKVNPWLGPISVKKHLLKAGVDLTIYQNNKEGLYKLCKKVSTYACRLEKKTNAINVVGPKTKLHRERLTRGNNIDQVLPLADNEVVPHLGQIENEPAQQSKSEIKTELTQMKSNINELKSEMVELISTIGVELHAFKASVQSDMTEIKSMLCQFGAI